MRVEDQPPYLATHDMDSFKLKFFTEARHPFVAECDWVLFNTFYELEMAAIDALRNDGNNACPIGPLVFTPLRVPENPSSADELTMATSGSALWVEDGASLRWLISIQPRP